MRKPRDFLLGQATSENETSIPLMTLIRPIGINFFLVIKSKLQRSSSGSWKESTTRISIGSLHSKRLSTTSAYRIQWFLVVSLLYNWWTGQFKPAITNRPNSNSQHLAVVGRRKRLNISLLNRRNNIFARQIDSNAINSYLKVSKVQIMKKKTQLSRKLKSESLNIEV